METKTLINGNPDWKNVQVLADYFWMINETVGKTCNLKMEIPKIPADGHLCGTSACHAGWFGYFYEHQPSSSNHSEDFSKNYFGNYTHKIAQLLGFERSYELKTWARFNSQIWGNGFGSEMFGSDFAFLENSFQEKVTLETIANHWQGVSDRLRVIQEGV